MHWLILTNMFAAEPIGTITTYRRIVGANVSCFTFC